jgi:hypothetical protein
MSHFFFDILILGIKSYIKVVNHVRIFKGDNGIPLPFTVRKQTKVENLTDAVVTVSIERGKETYTKPAIIENPILGKCSLLLTSTDLSMVGMYKYQWTVYFPDGRSYSGNPLSFYVDDKLINTPAEPDDGTIHVVVDGGDFTLNPQDPPADSPETVHVKVDGGEF